MEKKYFLGIDLHKKTLTWSLLDDKGTELHCATVKSHPDNISTALKKMHVPLPEIQAAIEPTCGWRWVSELLESNGIAVKYAHPLKVRMIANSTQKTDHNDAFTLANLLRTKYLPESYRVPKPIYELRVLVHERVALVRARVGAYNRLHGIATTQGIHMIPGNNPRSKAGRKHILEGDNIVLKEIHSLTDMLGERIAVYDSLIAEKAKEFSDVALLMSAPGVGIVTATTIVAEVGNFSRFPTPKKLASYAGLVPRQRSSGEKVRLGSITKTGSPILRSILVEAAMRIHEKGAPELYGFVKRLQTSGKKPARVALARKLITLMWHMVITQKPYDKALVRCGEKE